MQVRAGTPAAGLIEKMLDVQMAGSWKPAAASYAYACKECNVSPSQVCLVAVHPWDVHGAKKAASRAHSWTGAGWPERGFGAAPKIAARSMGELADVLLGADKRPRDASDRACDAT
jgi:2-haloacid dehalogenase